MMVDKRSYLKSVTGSDVEVVVWIVATSTVFAAVLTVNPPTLLSTAGLIVALYMALSFFIGIGFLLGSLAVKATPESTGAPIAHSFGLMLALMVVLAVGLGMYGPEPPEPPPPPPSPPCFYADDEAGRCLLTWENAEASCGEDAEWIAVGGSPVRCPS